MLKGWSYPILKFEITKIHCTNPFHYKIFNIIYSVVAQQSGLQHTLEVIVTICNFHVNELSFLQEHHIDFFFYNKLIQQFSDPITFVPLAIHMYNKIE